MVGQKMAERDRKILKAALILDRLVWGDDPKAHLKRKMSSMENAKLLTEEELDGWLRDLEWKWLVNGETIEERMSGIPREGFSDDRPSDAEDDWPLGNDDWYYTPSVTGGDYGPGNPWDAPGMTIHDFI